MYNVILDEFEGPLDLLLHLIKQSDINIYDINIENITKQYLDYIRMLEDMNLTVMSEYLVLASELIEIKSKLLIPSNKNEFEENVEEDPREAFINKLIEYQKYKNLTKEFKDLEETRKMYFTKIPSDVTEYKEETDITMKDILSIDTLVEVFNKFLNRKLEDKPLNTKITVKEITINDRINYIRKILNNKEKVLFKDLFDNYNKSYIVVTFMSILEMMKKKEINVKQNKNFDDIYITKNESNGEVYG